MKRNPAWRGLHWEIHWNH